MAQEEARIFDVEGFINQLRVRIKRSSYAHKFFFNEDLVINYKDDNEVSERKVKWTGFRKSKQEKGNKIENYQGAYVEITNPILRIQFFLQNIDRIVGESPAIEERPSYQPHITNPFIYYFKRRPKGIVIREKIQHSPHPATTPPSPQQAPFLLLM